MFFALQVASKSWRDNVARVTAMTSLLSFALASILEERFVSKGVVLLLKER